MNNNLNRIPFLIELSRKTFWVVAQNVILGMAFIVVFGTMALAGLLAPWMAAVLHLSSGLLVIFNSARLVRAGEDIEHHEAERMLAAGRPRPQVEATSRPADEAGGAVAAPA
jgi:Cd2+/Zn2+-exporting ATPase